MADVAGNGFELSLWDLLWPLGWACLSVVLVVPVTCLLVVRLTNLVTRLFSRPMGDESAPGRPAGDTVRPANEGSCR